MQGFTWCAGQLKPCRVAVSRGGVLCITCARVETCGDRVEIVPVAIAQWQGAGTNKAVSHFNLLYARYVRTRE